MNFTFKHYFVRIQAFGIGFVVAVLWLEYLISKLTVITANQTDHFKLEHICGKECWLYHT